MSFGDGNIRTKLLKNFFSSCRLEPLKWIEKTIEEKKKQKKSEKCVECGGSGMITDCIGGLDWAYKDGYNRAIEDIQLLLHDYGGRI